MRKLIRLFSALIASLLIASSSMIGASPSVIADEARDAGVEEHYGIRGDPGYVGEPVKISPQDLALLEELDRQALESFGVEDWGDEAPFTGSRKEVSANHPIAPGGGPWAMTVYGAHPFPQEQTWTCGPATYRMIANVYGYPTSERNAIRFVGATPSSGTSLSMIQKALNDIPGVACYRMQPLPSYGGSAIPRSHISTFKNRANADLNRGRPLAVNVSIPAGVDYFPKGYPTDRTIAHHMAVMGYRNGGAQMHIYDPMGNSPAFINTRYDKIKPMYDYETEKLVRAMGYRGYLW